jgi:hypothetical protein
MTLRGRLLGCALFLGVTLVPAVTAERPLLATHDALDEGGLSEQVVQLEQSVRQRTLLHRMLVRPITAQRTPTRGAVPSPRSLSFSTLHHHPVGVYARRACSASMPDGTTAQARQSQPSRPG